MIIKKYTGKTDLWQPVPVVIFRILCYKHHYLWGLYFELVYFRAEFDDVFGVFVGHVINRIY